MENNAHLKLEIVLNEEEENDEEKRFNEIICYDSGDSEGDANEDEQSYTNELPKAEDPPQSSLQNQQNVTQGDGIEKTGKKSNAAQMRKYRERQRSDPIRYQQYLERERIRNYKRKYEKRIQEAQEKAQAMGIPYIVLDPPHVRRGRKPYFGDMSLVLPAKYEDDDEDGSNSFNWDDMPMMPVQVELQESDEIYQEQKPQISVVNINKLLGQQRSALQTLLPQEVNDREQVNNFIKLEHDYVKHQYGSMFDQEIRKRSGKNKRKREKNELLKLQQQCRSFISNQSVADNSSNLKQNRRERRMRIDKKLISTNFVPKNCVEHEDLDDLFKELAEVANKTPPKKNHSSPHEKSSVKHSNRKESFCEQMRDGEFSLTVSMPVKPIVPFKC